MLTVFDLSLGMAESLESVAQDLVASASALVLLRRLEHPRDFYHHLGIRLVAQSSAAARVPDSEPLDSAPCSS